MRLVYYSLANRPEDSREQQWMISIRSLRQFNKHVAVVLFLFHGASKELLEEAERQRVSVIFLGEYRDFLLRRYAHGDVVSLLPTFHKFLVLEHDALHGASQILYLDCDTFLFGDVEQLFAACTEASLYAREEPNSQRSISGGNPSHIDEEMLAAIVAAEGLRAVAPFNTGVCLMNHGVWHEIETINVTELDYAWRLLCGCEMGRGQRANDDEDLQRAVRRSWNEIDRHRCLPYPSSNLWIIEQIALWLALGRLPNLTTGLLTRHLVAQGDEFIAMMHAGCPPVLAHYFTTAEGEFLNATRTLRQ